MLNREKVILVFLVFLGLYLYHKRSDYMSENFANYCPLCCSYTRKKEQIDKSPNDYAQWYINHVKNGYNNYCPCDRPDPCRSSGGYGGYGGGSAW